MRQSRKFETKIKTETQTKKIFTFVLITNDRMKDTSIQNDSSLMTEYAYLVSQEDEHLHSRSFCL